MGHLWKQRGQAGCRLYPSTGCYLTYDVWLETVKEDGLAGAMRHLEVGVGRDQELEMESNEAGVLEEPEMRSDNQGETNDGEDKGQEEGRELLWGPVCLGGSAAVSS